MTVTFAGIATTEDTGDPVIRASITDTKSYMDMILDRAEQTIRVWLVESQSQGDMKRMLDETVTQVGWNDVIFLSPLDDKKFDALPTLKERLQGFEKRVEEHESPEGELFEQEQYISRWETPA